MGKTDSKNYEHYLPQTETRTAKLVSYLPVLLAVIGNSVTMLRVKREFFSRVISSTCVYIILLLRFYVTQYVNS